VAYNTAFGAFVKPQAMAEIAALHALDERGRSKSKR
jgi:hypothetical protein